MKETAKTMKGYVEKIEPLIDRRYRNKAKILVSVQGTMLKPNQCFKMQD